MTALRAVDSRAKIDYFTSWHEPQISRGSVYLVSNSSMNAASCAVGVDAVALPKIHFGCGGGVRAYDF